MIFYFTKSFSGLVAVVMVCCLCTWKWILCNLKCNLRCAFKREFWGTDSFVIAFLKETKKMEREIAEARSFFSFFFRYAFSGHFCKSIWINICTYPHSSRRVQFMGSISWHFVGNKQILKFFIPSIFEPSLEEKRPTIWNMDIMM